MLLSFLRLFSSTSKLLQHSFQYSLAGTTGLMGRKSAATGDGVPTGFVLGFLLALFSGWVVYVLLSQGSSLPESLSVSYKSRMNLLRASIRL